MFGLSLIELIKGIEEKKFSDTEVNDYFVKRIKKYDGALNSYLTIQEQFDSQIEAPLKGLALAIKDNFSTTGVTTTASSKVLGDYIPQFDATVIRRLKHAGANILGKTNMDAWAHGSSTETSDYGATRNPYSKERVAGGSSGGSAAAVAAYLAPASIGSETAGSIRGPAAWSGAVGLKPTYGRVSRYGVVAMGSSWDCPGPITSTVKDAALLLEMFAGHDIYDGTTSNQKVDSYVSEVDDKKRFTIGVAEEYLQNLDKDVLVAYEETLKTLEKMGHTIKKISLIDPKYAISVYMILQRSEVSSNLGRYDGIRYGFPRDHFADEAERRIMLGTYALSTGYYDAYYKKAQKVRKVISNNFKEVLKDVDVLFAPTMPITATKLGDADKFAFYGEIMDILTEPAAAAGIPAISIPVGLSSEGLPIGMQFMGRHFDETSLISIAYQLEQEVNFDRLKIIKSHYPDIA